MKKNELFAKIKGLYIQIPFQETIYKMIERNLHRVEFVKDHIGLRDFLFIAEKGTGYHDELFVALNVPVSKRYTLEQNEEKMLLHYESHPFKVVEQLQEFFKTTDRTLYVGVGFARTEPTEEEYMSIEFSYQTGLIESKIQAHRELRMKKFPLWYRENAKLPEEVVGQMEEIVLPEEIEKTKADIMKQIDLALDNGNQEAFFALAKEYKRHKK